MGVDLDFSGYLDTFASPELRKVAFLGQESDWIPSSTVAKICLKSPNIVP